MSWQRIIVSRVIELSTACSDRCRFMLEDGRSVFLRVHSSSVDRRIGRLQVRLVF